MANLSMANVSNIRPLLESIGETGPYNLTEINGGFNNRTFRLDTGKKRYLLKEYFRDDKDPRDRLGTEYNFCNFATTHGVDGVAKALACDSSLGVGLYEFIEGVDCGPKDVSLARVLEAAHFFRKLNEKKGNQAAKDLGNASEACFSLDSHLVCVSQRIECLAGIPLINKTDERVSAFARKNLGNQLQDIRKIIERSGLPDKIAAYESCLSASDFGFHNMLIDNKGSLRFVDFEYAGWDDPAKMVCDFFCQPRVPVPIKWVEVFIEESLTGHFWTGNVRKRVKLLYPLYRLKWCCIILNEFLPTGSGRRAFSSNSLTNEGQKLAKLEAAEKYLGATASLGKIN
jgi:thiamine kinase-like enzyme